MEEKSNNSKPSFTQAQLQQLLSLRGDSANTQKAKKSLSSQKMMEKIANVIKNTLYYLDRFINFITKKNDKDRNDVVQIARAPILFGTYVTVFFVLVGLLWGSFAPLDSAAVASGVLVATSNKKIIQHQEGGIIKKIFVNQGDKVKTGDKLIELEDTKIKSQYESTLSQYRHAVAIESRLIAERDNHEQIEFPEILTENIKIPEVARIIHTQESLFSSKKEVYRSEKNALNQKIEQLNKKIEGLQARKVGYIKSLEVLKDRLSAANTLFKKGFAHKATLLDLEVKEANCKSEIAMTETEIASTHHIITETEINYINLQSKYTEKMLTELRDAQGQVAHFKEQFNSHQDSLNRIIIKSPVDGVVNVIYYHTIGGVISQGSQILEISPTDDRLIIEARVSHKNIDSVHVGLVAKIRFSAFKSRTTPSFTGKVVSISPDIVQDKSANPDPNNNVYIARIEIDMDEFNKLAKAKNLQLHPGMQAEVQIVTGTRTLFGYLLDPITDTMFRAFREK